MKNKITKLFFVLMISGFTAHSQNAKEVKQILAETNVEFLKQYEVERSKVLSENLSQAYAKARELGKPVNGVDELGNAFQLVGIDPDTKDLLYYKTTNNVPVGSSLRTANAKPLQALGLTGKNVKVAIWDGGVASNSHVSLAGRIQVKDNGNTGMSPEGIDHATHVTGTVAANDKIIDAKGFATEATIWAYNFNGDDPEMSAAANLGLLVSNHSYGMDASKSSSLIPGIFGRYSYLTQPYDVIANNAPMYTMVFAAGNDRNPNSNPGNADYNPNKGGRDLLSGSGVAKNVIVVASTKGTENFSEVATATSPSTFLSRFSNWGPTDDFRIKPDIAAKGEDVFSLGSKSLGATSVKSGTSMATPAVTGVVILWQEYFNQLFSQYMRSATVRAIMAHSAREAGEAEGPDYKFGWGLIDADAGAQIMRERTQEMAVLAELTMSQSATLNYDFVYDGKQPLIATIAWNDPAGSILNTTNVNVASLVNDLDIKLINTDTNDEYFPWALVHSWTSTGSGIAVRNAPNTRDNIEKINVPNSAVAGNYRLVVNHKGTLKNGKQDFSLVISGSGNKMPEIGDLSTKERRFSKLDVYPNPAKDILNLEGEVSELRGANIEVYDISGKRVFVKQNAFANDVEVLNISNLQNGVYLIDISNNGMRQISKFIKK